MSTPYVHNLSLEIGTVLGFPVYWYGAVYTVGFGDDVRWRAEMLAEFRLAPVAHGAQHFELVLHVR